MILVASGWSLYLSSHFFKSVYELLHPVGCKYLSAYTLPNNTLLFKLLIKSSTFFHSLDFLFFIGRLWISKIFYKFLYPLEIKYFSHFPSLQMKSLLKINSNKKNKKKIVALFLIIIIFL